MKKVLCELTTYFGNGGGLANAVLNYFRCLWRNPDLRDKYIIDFASCNDIPEDLNNEISQYGSKYYKLAERKKDPFRYFKELKKLAKEGKYDVLHLNCNSATGALDLIVCRNIPNRIVHCHSSGSQFPIVHILMKPIFNTLYTNAVASSKTAGEWVFDNRHFIVLNNAIEVEKFTFSESVRHKLRKQYYIDDQTMVIGHVGKMASKSKNQEYLLEIFPEIKKRLPNSILFLVGDGLYLEKLKKIAKESNYADSIIFAGFKTNIYEYMQMFDLFVFPSVYEGLGMVAIEAQASGLRCIISQNVPSEVKVTDRIEFIGIDEADKIKWVESCVRLLQQYDNEERRLSIPNIQKQIREHGYDISTELNKLISIYDQ